MSDIQCPWDRFEPGTLRFCEAHLCSWVVAPAETYSNILFIVIGGALFLTAGPKDQTRRLLGMIAGVIGVFSGLYHASHLWVTETFDLGAMGFLSSFLLCHALLRWGWLKAEKFWHFYWGLSATSWIALLFVDGPPRLWIFAAVIFLYVQMEGILAIRARRLKLRVNYKPLFATVALFLISYAFWLADFYRWSCDPSNHLISGHSAWHVMNAFCFLTLERFLRQFGTPWLAESHVDRYA